MQGSDWEFAHIGVIVRDSRAAYDFYKSLGFTPVNEPFETKPRTTDNPRTSLISRLARGGGVVEFIQPLEGRWINMDFLQESGEGINHICFSVDDIAAEKRRMVAMGFPVLFESDRAGYFDTRRVGNVIIELLQKQPQA